MTKGAPLLPPTAARSISNGALLHRGRPSRSSLAQDQQQLLQQAGIGGGVAATPHVTLDNGADNKEEEAGLAGEEDGLEIKKGAKGKLRPKTAKNDKKKLPKIVAKPPLGDQELQPQGLYVQSTKMSFSSSDSSLVSSPRPSITISQQED